jgi:hypothetical protein
MNTESWLALKWLLLVWANAAVSFFFALHEFAAWPDLLGIASGVFCSSSFTGGWTWNSCAATARICGGPCCGGW